jgi:predicted membrane channel-forming protein YqfA (hemolysin III family)
MQAIKYLIYILMVVIGVITMYTILNAGNPKSLLRPYFPDPQHDIYLALLSSIIVFVLGFFVFYSRDREGFEHIIQLNEKRIRELRQTGKQDEEIAASILSVMGSHSGYRQRMAQRKLVAYLSEFK